MQKTGKTAKDFYPQFAELYLFLLDDDINILFNPESLAYCNISRAIVEILQEIFPFEYKSGEVKIRIAPGQAQCLPQLRDLFDSLKISRFVHVSMPSQQPLTPHDRRLIPQTVSIIPALACNQQCRYCWNTHGTYGDISKVIMDHKTALQVGRWISKHIESDGRDGIRKVEFFGGEPLLAAQAFMTITEAIRATANKYERKTAINLSTNGLLLTDDLISFCRDYKVKIAISLDGPAEVHNSMRIDALRQGTHSRVLKVVRRIQKIYPDGIQVRATVAHSCDFMELYDYGHSLGINEFSAWVALPEQIGPEGGVFLSDIHGMKYSRAERFEFIKTYFDRLLSGKKVYFIKPIFDMIASGLDHTVKIQPCPLNATSPCVLPEGSFAPCFRFPFDRSKIIGNVWNDVDIKRTAILINEVNSQLVSDDALCRTCFARYKCGGPCYALKNAFKTRWGPPYPGCESIKEYLLMDFYATAILAKKDSVFFKKLQENNRGKQDKKSVYELFEEHYLHKVS